jgi:hypothetical protein
MAWLLVLPLIWIIAGRRPLVRWSRDSVLIDCHRQHA